MFASLTTETATAAQAAAHKAFTTTSGSLKPSAKVVRAALKAAGLEHLIQGRIGTGTNACTVSLEGSLEERTLAVKVLRILWADSAERIWSMDYQGLPVTAVRISVDNWTRVVMATLAEEPSDEEMERRAELGRQAVALLRAQLSPAATVAVEQDMEAELAEDTRPTEAELDAQVEADRIEDMEREMADEASRARDEASRIEQDRADEESARLEYGTTAYALEEEAQARRELAEALGRTEPIEATTTVTLVDRQEWRSIWGHFDLGGARRMVRRDALRPGDMAWSSHYGLSTVGYVHAAGLTTEVVWIGPTSQGLARSERYDSASTVPLFSTATEVDRANARQWLADIHAGVRAIPCRACNAPAGQPCRLHPAFSPVTLEKLGGHFERYWDAERGARA